MRLRRIRELGAEVLLTYFQQHLARAAAGLSYFLTLSFFPMLILLYQMLGSFLPPVEQLRAFLTGVLPESAAEIIEDFLGYVSENLDSSMLAMALSALVTSSSAAFRCIDNVTAEMRGSTRYSGFLELLFSAVFALVFLAALYLAVILTVTGKWFLELLDRRIMFMNLSDSWSWARFVLLFVLLFAMLLWLYRMTAPRGGGRAAVMLPGAVLASLAIVGVSVAFSAMISVNVSYPVVYGSLASLMILMLWLYLCGVIILLGIALNVALERRCGAAARRKLPVCRPGPGRRI